MLPMAIFLFAVQAGSFIVGCLTTLAAIVRRTGAGTMFLTWLAFAGLIIINGFTYGLSLLIGWWALIVWASLVTAVVSYVSR